MLLAYGTQQITIEDGSVAKALRNLILRIIDSGRPTWLPIPHESGTIELLITAGVPIAIAFDEPVGAASDALDELIRELFPEVDDQT